MVLPLIKPKHPIETNRFPTKFSMCRNESWYKYFFILVNWPAEMWTEAMVRLVPRGKAQNTEVFGYRDEVE